jgi:hypothetical protein
MVDFYESNKEVKKEFKNQLNGFSLFYNNRAENILWESK